MHAAVGRDDHAGRALQLLDNARPEGLQRNAVRHPASTTKVKVRGDARGTTGSEMQRAHAYAQLLVGLLYCATSVAAARSTDCLDLHASRRPVAKSTHRVGRHCGTAVWKVVGAELSPEPALQEA
jgi:hypothetical protein